ncbi:tetratricopeptide TPR_1 repeat-containing protein [Rubidibacter lacunae KORDI 51-2]|uniref:Tetratricopeptide TPR_1 repeat-containing protein n=2 Tax=Rubidibacter TaxID=582491 RepID=U5DQT5_9CHRO|nr:tetratricopeptide TPR_1 repeat-containing protein [Rubidibacter lacunae KORDI 51-2]
MVQLSLHEYKSAYAERALVSGAPVVSSSPELMARACPDRARVNYFLGLAYAECQNYPQALESLREAVTICSDYPEALYQRGLIYFALGNFQFAIADFNYALHLYSQFYGGTGFDTVGSTIDTIEGIVGDFCSPLSERQQALQDRVALAKLHNDRGLAHEKWGDSEAAVADFNRAVRYDPDFAAAYVHCGNVYYECGNYDAAIDSFGCALVVAPDSSAIVYRRGLARAARGRATEAIADFNHSIALNPDCAKVYLHRGITHMQTGNWIEAVADYERAIWLDPESECAYLQRGLAYHELGDFEGAIADYNRSLELNPDLYHAFESRERAHKSLEASWEPVPTPDDFKSVAAKAYLYRGIESIRIGNQRGAIADFDHALAIVPDNVEALYNRSIAYNKLNDCEAAIADLRRILQLHPDFGNAADRMFQLQLEFNSHKFRFGTILHPISRHWQVWFALHGRYVTCVFASGERSLAESVRGQLETALDARELDAARAIVEVIGNVESIDGSLPVDPLPDNSVEQIERRMRRFA